MEFANNNEFVMNFNLCYKADKFVCRIEII